MDNRFLSDTPVKDPANDSLGRSPFARTLARAIAALQADDGFTFALYGSWGTGKTTTLNFVLHYLKTDVPQEQQPIIVHFNPWWFSDGDQLLLRFFEQMRTVLSQPNVPSQLQDIGRKIQLFGKAISPLTYLPAARELVVGLRDLAEAVGGTLEGIGKDAEKDLHSLRDSIDSALKEQDKHILIVIDDLDRLSFDEIRLMFRLVKAVANFPKVIYLLAFDRTIVTSALHELVSGAGEQFLEKIVQAGFDLPLPDKPLLRSMLCRELDLVLQETPENLWDETHWANVYWDGIDHFITKPRDVKRLINSLRPSYGAVLGEVNPIDFIAVEVLRVFVPELYSLLRNNQDLFAGVPEGNQIPGHDTRTELKTKYDHYFSETVPSEHLDPAKKILGRLFPQVAWAYGGNLYDGSWLGRWTRKLLICSPEVFPVYFRLSVGDDEVSAAQLRALIELSEDVLALAKEFERLAQERRRDGPSSRVRGVLERLEAYTEEAIPTDKIESFLQALYDAGDSILAARDRVGIYDFENDMRVLRITRQLLSRLPSQSDRFEVLKRVFSRTKSVAMAVHELVIEGNQHGKFGAGKPQVADPAERTISIDQVTELEKVVLAKIEQAAEDNTLHNSPNLITVLLVWRELTGSDEAPRAYTTPLLENDQGVANFLRGLLEQAFSQTIGDRSTKSRWYVRIPRVAKVVDIADLKGKVTKLHNESPAWLTDKDKLAIQTFLKYVDKPSTDDPFDN